jgi:hypothetical protein
LVAPEIQGDGQQPGPALARQHQRRLTVAALRGGIGSLAKQRSGLCN